MKRSHAGIAQKVTEMPGLHARLSPSGSKRWLKCAGSIVLESAFPNTSNTYSDDGTAMHTVAAICLDQLCEASYWVGQEITVSDADEPLREVLFTEEMAVIMQGYIDAVRALADGHALFVEQRVEFTEFVFPGNEAEEMILELVALGKTRGEAETIVRQFGTADAIILRGDGEMMLIDLKTGYRYVDVIRSSQLMLYALGAYRMFDLTHTITSIRLMIYQPQHGGMREWVTTVEDLMEFAAEAREAAQKVERATAVFSAILPAEEKTEWAAIYLHPHPNKEDCWKCRAMATCPAYTAMVVDTVGADFEVIIENPAVLAHVSREDSAALSAMMKATGAIEDWITAVRAEVERRLLANVEVPDFGLELGREGNRKWDDPTKAEDYMRKTLRLPMEVVYDMKLISPTSAEELAPKLNKDGIEIPLKPSAPVPKMKLRQWEKLKVLIARSPAVPSVKPLSQIKVLYKPTAPDADAFEVIDENADLT